MTKRCVTFSKYRWCMLALGALLTVGAGCYQRSVPPELSYEPSQVETLDQEIEQLDWD